MSPAKIYPTGIPTRPVTDLVELLHENATINPDLYQKYNVKRGLRNANGTGVCVGITKVSDVVGYEVLDGVKIATEGKLFYRGIEISEIVENVQKDDRFGFEEVAYLLLFGELPSESMLTKWNALLDLHRNLPRHFVEDHILNTPSKNIMNKLQRSVLTLYSFDPNPDDTSLENVLTQCIDLIAKMPILMSYSYQAMKHYFMGESLVLHNVKKDASTAEDILMLCRDDQNFTREEALLLDLLLIVQADHGGGNNSTFATHVVSSTGTDTYSAISTALGSLKGPKHGGANAQVSAMLSDIKINVKDWNNADEVNSYIAKILDKEAFDRKGLVYGMGHAVYTISDPRCELLREKAGEVAKLKGREDEFHLLNHIENQTKILMKERRGQDFNVAGNVDLYTGFVLNMLEIPEALYTPVFAASRMAGWCSHRIEQVMDEKIIRPAYISLAEKRSYTPISQR